MMCAPWHENGIPQFAKLEDFHLWLAPLIQQEIEFREKGILIKGDKEATAV